MDFALLVEETDGIEIKKRRKNIMTDA